MKPSLTVAVETTQSGLYGVVDGSVQLGEDGVNQPGVVHHTVCSTRPALSSADRMSNPIPGS